MRESDFLFSLFLILCCARLLGEVAARWNIPSVIGELMAGIILGPSLLHLIDFNEPIKLLSEIGIILLLFEVGLETDIVKLKSTRIKPFVVAIGGVIVPLILGYWVSFFIFHLSTLGSLLVGCTLTATSIGITMRVFNDLKRQTSHEAHIVLGAAVLDDVIGIILLSVVYAFSQGKEIDYLTVLKITAYISLFLVIAPFIAKLLSVVIERCKRKSVIPGLIPSMGISLILFFSWLADCVGAPVILGGFAAGIAFSPQFMPTFNTRLKIDPNFNHEITTNMKPLIHLFVPIFFVGVGLSLNLKEINLHSSFVWLFTGSILAVAIIGKLTSGFLLFREKRFIKWAVGIAMIPRGEVGLIFAQMGQSSMVLNDDLYAALLTVIATTTVVTPFALSAFYRRPLD